MDLKSLGRYRILGELGRGAMGTVYRAVDPLIEREVAIKALDYLAEFAVEANRMLNSGRLGAGRCRVAPEQFTDSLVDEIGRYMLGTKNEFARLVGK